MLNSALATRAMGVTTYLEKFSDEGDALNSEYKSLFDRFAPGDATPGTLLEHLVNSDGMVPLVFLCLVQEDGKSTIKTLHRFTRYRKGLATSPHDGQTFVFVNDVVTGHQIEMALFESKFLETVGPIKVRSREETELALETMPAEAELLEPMENQEGTVEVTVRRVVPVPHCYLHMVMGNDRTPKALWNELVGAIVVEDRVEEMSSLIDWMLAAIHDDGAGNAYVCNGDYMETLRPAVGRPLLKLRHEILKEDLELDNGRTRGAGESEAVAQVLQHMEQTNQRERARQRAEKLQEKAPKMPSDAYPETTKLWLLTAGVDAEEDLPPLYKRLANVPKKESARLVMESVVGARCREDDSAGKQDIIVTKELFEMTKQGRFGSQAFCDDLTAGVNPFTCGYGKGPHTKTIAVRTEHYDQMAIGDTRPSLTEQLHFRTKEVVLPDNDHLFKQMLQSTSVVIDVIQGTGHPHARLFRRFATADADGLMNIYFNLSPEDRLQAGNIYPRILREVQLMMNAYYHDLLAGDEPNLPNYGDIMNMARRRKWSTLAELPYEYLANEQPPNLGPIGGTVSQTPGGGADGRTAGWGNLGERLENTTPTSRKWQLRFKNSGKELKKLKPPVGDDGKEICMSWHFKGFCFENCQRKHSHCLLVGTTKSKVQSFVDRTFKETRNGGAPGDDGQGAGASGSESKTGE